MSSQTIHSDHGPADSEPVVISCPVCSLKVPLDEINGHLDAGCSNTASDARENLPGHPAHTAKIFTPTQNRKLSQKREVLETPQGNGRSSQKRKASELEERPLPTVRTLPRGKEALIHAAPLAERARPRALDEFVGQEDLVGQGGLLRGLIDAGRVPSLIFWGSSGTGKTTLARIIAKSAGEEFTSKELSATSNNVADCKKVFEDASNLLSLTGKKTIVFLDEIHRFTKR